MRKRKISWARACLLVVLLAALAAGGHWAWRRWLAPAPPLPTPADKQTLARNDISGAFRVLVFPDSQCSDGYATWREIVDAANQRHGDARLMVSMGDLVDNGEDANQWRQWTDAARPLLDKMLFAPVMGNHETYTLDWQTRLPLDYLQLFADRLPDNGSRKYKGYYYSFDAGDAHFTVLNTSMYELEAQAPELADEQLAWLERDLAATTKPWKVVLMHRDVLQYRIHGRPDRPQGFSDEGVMFMPLFEKHGVDLVLTAHLHTYRNRRHLWRWDESPDGRGPLYILTGIAGNVRYPGLWVDHDLDKAKAPQPETCNYLTMDVVDAHTVKLVCWLPDGTKIDEATLAK